MQAFVRDLLPGMGQAVAERTVLRRKADGQFEKWGDVARRVALGNALLCPDPAAVEAQRANLEHHIAKATLLMSGRHLQHGDETQPNRNQEVFTNCLDGATLVLSMEYGPVALADVAGQTITVIAGDGVPRPAIVNAHGEQQLFDIVFRPVLGGGTKIRNTVRATANHRWLLRGGGVTSELSVGDIIAAPTAGIERDPLAVVHGLLYGDGTAHKRRHDHTKPSPSQGRTYAGIRVCKQDAVRDQIHEILDAADYSFTCPPHAGGDRVYYVGKFPYAKEPPHTVDPEYIAGFIYGWWLADGSKHVNGALAISSSDDVAVAWLKAYAAYGGFTVTSHRIVERRDGDGSFPNGKPLHVVRVRERVEWCVESITPAGRAPVFCPEEPVTKSFVLANGLLTGNCSTAATTFALFLLLLNGSGVGRCYDDDMMLVNWDNAPTLRVVLDQSHPDFDWSADESVRDARHKYGNGKDVLWHDVEDSREGWAKALEIWENAAFEKIHKDKLLILNFTPVRCKNSPIAGMQGRPASGPRPLMNAFVKAATLKGGGLPPWLQAMYIDHYFAECVLVGGARRAARMATKFWKDRSVLTFAHVKRPIEYGDLAMSEVVAHRKNATTQPGAFLWSSNNSITVDAEFWKLVVTPADEAEDRDLWNHAQKVWKAISEASYGDGTGEPGVLNVDKLVQNDDGWEGMEDGAFIGSKKYQVEDDTRLYLSRLAKRAKKKTYNVIVNPCAEIVLNLLGGYCVIADVVPYHADTFAEAADAFRAATRALIRVNLMDCLYRRETRRTNRIGVGMTGVHEFAWKFFKVGFRDLVNPDFDAYTEYVDSNLIDNDEIIGSMASEPGIRAAAFWHTLSAFNAAVRDEAIRYSRELGVAIPHTMTTIKPAGTTSKLFGLTEGWHLPSMREFLRWVQFREDDPLVQEYEAQGYPTRKLTSYTGTVIVGFPTQPTICTLGMGDALVTAAEANPEDQYKWVSLGERFWITGLDAQGNANVPDYGNQISYTLKYTPQVVGFEEFTAMMLQHQPNIRCCSVMPQEDTSAYEYQPESVVTKAEFEAMVASIKTSVTEDVSFDSVDCASGACPVSFDTRDRTELGRYVA